MQVNLYWHKDKFYGKDPTGTLDNIFVGSSILSDCIDKAKRLSVNKKSDKRKRKQQERETLFAKAMKCYNGGGNHKYTALVNQALRDVPKFPD